MKKIIVLLPLLFISFLLPLAVAAQKKLKVEKPDLEQIRRATLDPASKFYYPKLQMYEVNDTVMTPEQYRYYYFGSMYQEDYNPYRKSDYTDRTDSLLNLNYAARQRRDSTMEADKAKKLGAFELKRRYENARTRNMREQREIVKIAEMALADNPFDLQSMYMLSRLLKDMGKDMLSRIWDYRLESFLLEVLGYDVDDYEYREPGYDYLKVSPSDSSRATRSRLPEGFFFDVRPLIQQYNIKYPENSAESTATGDEIILEN